MNLKYKLFERSWKVVDSPSMTPAQRMTFLCLLKAAGFRLYETTTDELDPEYPYLYYLLDFPGERSCGPFNPRFHNTVAQSPSPDKERGIDLYLWRDLQDLVIRYIELKEEEHETTPG